MPPESTISAKNEQKSQICLKGYIYNQKYITTVTTDIRIRYN